jgi:glycosyltransferase involved in cell wall biosynthesis
MADDGISVIIPAYNVDGFIAEAFASIAALSTKAFATLRMPI